MVEKSFLYPDAEPLSEREEALWADYLVGPTDEADNQRTLGETTGQYEITVTIPELPDNWKNMSPDERDRWQRQHPKPRQQVFDLGPEDPWDSLGGRVHRS